MNTTEQKIERFIHTLESLGGSAGNQKLRDALGWQETTYDSIKQQLPAQGFISLLDQHYPSWREARMELNELPLGKVD